MGLPFLNQADWGATGDEPFQPNKQRQHVSARHMKRVWAPEQMAPDSSRPFDPRIHLAGRRAVVRYEQPSGHYRQYHA